MKFLHRDLIMSFIFIFFITNIVTHANTNDSDLDIDQLRQLSNSRSKETQYMEAMQVLREQIRKILLPNIWKQTQEDPKFKIGIVSTFDLFQKLNQFNIFQNDTHLILQADSDRRSDFYVLNEGWGVINNSQMADLFNTKSGLLLPFHIFLGSSGYQDENYQLSLALILFDQSMDSKSDLNSLEITKVFPQIKENLYKKEPTLIKSNKPTLSNQKMLRSGNGGFTGVGGGGDGRSLLVKIEMISRYLFFFSNTHLSKEECFIKWSNPLNYLQDLLEVKIESDTEIEEVKLDLAGNSSKIRIPSFDPLDNLKFQNIVQTTMLSLCLIQSVKK